MKKYRMPHKARMKGKKAQAESQLNWIFILIVGAIILAFFTMIVIKQRGASEAKFAGKVSQQLNTILVGAKVASGTVQDIPTPELEIRFTCNDYYIGPASQRLGNRIVFAPQYVEGNRLITWTLDWNIPFKVTSFLYLTTPRVRYVIVANSESEPYANALYNALPEKLNKGDGVISMDDYQRVTDEGDDHVRFIFVNTGTLMNNIPSALSDVEVSGLSVDTSNANEKNFRFLVRSTVTSSAFNAPGGLTYFNENEVLYGAIFMDRPQDFECMMERSYSRLNAVASVYYAKLNEIAPLYAATNCEGFYDKNDALKQIMDNTINYPELIGLRNIAQAGRSLEETNDKLQLYSCPLIY